MSHEKILRMNHLCTARPSLPAIRFLMCGTTYPSKSYSINRPSSSVSCIEYVVSGTGHVRIDGQELLLRAGDSYYLPQGHDHCYYADKNDPWEKIWVNFSGPFADGLAALCGVSETYHYPALNTSDLLQKFQYYAAHREPEYAAEQCVALLTQLFYRLSCRVNAPPQEPQAPVRRMLLYLEQHAAEPITLEQIAAVCGKSPSQAERLFRKETGTPLYRYALERKIAIARQLLTETGMSVREIADYLSFSDEFYFSGLFRRKVGMSPTRYRESGGTGLSPNPEAEAPEVCRERNTEQEASGAASATAGRHTPSAAGQAGTQPGHADSGASE